jgi:predicted TPR repeat methyltransferase
MGNSSKQEQYIINKESYNNIAETWSEIRLKHDLNTLVKEFLSKIKPNGKILDIGCGTGYPNAKYFSDNGFSVVGIDISKNMLQKAIDQNIKNAEFYLCDFFEYIPNEKYDGVIAYDSFFHFPKNRQKNIYKIVSGWINIGGYLLFTHGNGYDEIEAKMFDKIFYYSSLKKDKVHKLLLKNGFEIILSIENYHEKNMEIDLIIIAKKVK